MSLINMTVHKGVRLYTWNYSKHIVHQRGFDNGNLLCAAPIEMTIYL